MKKIIFVIVTAIAFLLPHLHVNGMNNLADGVTSDENSTSMTMGKYLAEKADPKKAEQKQAEHDEEKKTEENKVEKKTVQIPDSVLNITKENTYPNPSQDLPMLQPSELTEKLISSSKVKIENPNLIRMLNETNVNSTPFALGYRAVIYLGQWPLHYE